MFGCVCFLGFCGLIDLFLCCLGFLLSSYYVPDCASVTSSGSAVVFGALLVGNIG